MRGHGNVTSMVDFSSITGESPAIKNVLGVLERVVRNPDVSVLVYGETGTGKEVMSRAIHDNSTTGQGIFVEVNCAAIPETLLESELFGYEKGAYTGAERTKRGLLELAHGGTLLLDEIGAMGINLQARVLKAIEEKSFRRLGGEEPLTVEARIISASNVFLPDLIQEERFREDLYYRLNELEVNLPPLRERDDDVILLAQHFIEEFDEQYDLEPRSLSDTAVDLLRRYHWPGNIRELRNAIKRAMILNDEPVLTPDMIPVSVRTTDSLISQVLGRKLVLDFPEKGLTFQAVEKRVVEHTLRLSNWNRAKAARMLDVSYPRLLRKIDKYDLGPSHEDDGMDDANPTQGANSA